MKSCKTSRIPKSRSFSRVLFTVLAIDVSNSFTPKAIIHSRAAIRKQKQRTKQEAIKQPDRTVTLRHQAASILEQISHEEDKDYSEVIEQYLGTLLDLSIESRKKLMKKAFKSV